MANFSPGQTGGDEGAARQLAISSGIGNPSSGIINYLAHGDTGYSQGDAEAAGLPLTSGIITGQRMAAIAPAVNSLTASKPEISSTFDTRASQLGAEKQPLIDRYQTLLDTIKGNQTKDINNQGQVLSTEYGKRGIPLSSGMYQQDLANKDTGINQNYTNQQTTTTLARESDLRDLTNQITNLAQSKTTALRDVDNKIAELQAGAGNSAVTDALANYRQQLADKFASRFDALDTQLKQAQIDQANAKATSNPYMAVPDKSRIFNTLTGEFSGGLPTSGATGAGGQSTDGVLTPPPTQYKTFQMDQG